MDSRDAIEYSSWLMSYTDSEQTKVLIDCLLSKVTQQQELLETVLGEIELNTSPIEEPAEVLLQSIKALIEQEPEVRKTKGYFEWYIK